MNSLDRAFIRAYARDLDVDSLTAAAAHRNAEQAVQPRRRMAQPASVPSADDPMVQVSYADGSWYRIEQHGQSAAKVSPPHAHYAPAPEPPAPPAARSGVGDDVDLMARFRPPMFRDVNLRSHLPSATAQADAVSATGDALPPAAAATAGTAMPSLDYTLAPPSPPVAPQVPLQDYALGDIPFPRKKVAVSPFAGLAKPLPAAVESSPAGLSEAELKEYAGQCRNLNCVMLDLAETESLHSPEEAHIMLVEMPLELIENESQRGHKRLLEAEQARQREALLLTLMQQETILGNSYEAQWLYGSEGSAKHLPLPPAEFAEPDFGCRFTPVTKGQTDSRAARIAMPASGMLKLAVAPPLPFGNAIAVAALHPILGSCLIGDDSLVEFSHEHSSAEAVSEAAPEEPEAHEPPVIEAPAPVGEPIAEAPAPERFAPAWEVDRIVWPVICDQLLADAGEQFQAAIAQFQCDQSPRVIAISGHERGEGRTTLAICLARTAAEMGLRVALVDADFASPSIAASLSLDTMNGWDGVLQGRLILNEAAIASIDDHLTVVPLEQPLKREMVDLHSDRLELAITQLAEAFDLVLLDAGPAAELLGEHGWLAPMSLKPDLLLAHDMRGASMLEVQHLIEQAQAAGAEVVGLAQTFAPDQA